jgi:hypothetical protein
MQRQLRSTVVSFSLSFYQFIDLYSYIYPALPLGERKGLVEIRQLMNDDPAYTNLSEEQEAAMKKDVVDARELKRLGARTTNKSAAFDYRAAMDQMRDMVRCIISRYLIHFMRLVPVGHLYLVSHWCFNCRVLQPNSPFRYIRAALDMLRQCSMFYPRGVGIRLVGRCPSP